MIDDERTTTGSDEQSVTGEKIDTDALPKDTLEDLDVTTEDGAELKGGAPKTITHDNC